MFAEPLVTLAGTDRGGVLRAGSEALATFGLLVAKPSGHSHITQVTPARAAERLGISRMFVNTMLDTGHMEFGRQPSSSLP